MTFLKVLSKYPENDFLGITRKYPLRGYILGVLTNTTAWDPLWGGDVSLRLYKCSSALPHAAVV